MGKSKFPGKPSKLVHKKRISVVHTNESPPDNGNLRFKDSDGGPENIGSDSKVSQKPPLQSCMKGSALTTKDDDADTKNDDDDDKDEDDSATATATRSEATVATSATTTTPAAGKKVKIGGVSFDAKTVKNKKKTVTFKNQLETSDDTNIVRKVYNPIGAPLAPIIKKECLNRAIRFKRSSCIVRPSRLTEIVKLSESKNELLQLAANQTGLNVLTKTTLDLNNSLTAITAAAASAITYQTTDGGDGEAEKSPSLSPVKIDGGGDSCFVLPKRSLHSKRVIKPNKRFLDGMISTKCRKKKILGKKLHKYRLDFHSGPGSGGDNIIWKAEGGSPACDEVKKDKPDFGSSIKGKPAIYNAFSKVILREPKLNVTTFNFGNAFEMLANKNKTASLIPCNICGVVSSFENPLQARKYGANCCEICRKFISKMIKKLALPATAETKPIECINGDGGCRIEPLQKNSPTKFSHNIFKERCQCCWLKRGLEIFHLPSMLRTRLINCLPVAMRDIRTLNLNSFVPKYSPFFLDQAAAAAEKNETFNIFASAMKTSSLEAASSLSIFAKDIKCASPTTVTAEKEVSTPPPKEPVPSVTEESEKPTEPEIVEANTRANRSRAKTEELATETAAPVEPAAITATPANDGPKRQKIDLKGPRVKHVCRSASIVLGQPLATFGDDSEEAMVTEEEGVVPMEETKPAVIDEGSLVITTVPEKEDKATSETAAPMEGEAVVAEKLVVKIEPGENAENAPPVVIKAAVKKIEAAPLAISKPNTRKVFNRPSAGSGASNTGLLTSKNINSFIQPHHKKAQLTVSGVANKEKPKKLTICIDFWENYDPVEVSRYGFGQIVAEGDDKSLATLKAICFLCGSAGHDRMIFCVCCCEPYHQFCIDEYNTLSGVPPEQPTSPGGDTSLIAKMDESDEDLGKSGSCNQESRLALLNWLCPRCTVCNTCNMTMGLKVKCQKCQKSYHNQCLGTNKRLFGADRPLICSNCLKCKSCGTTNVSKFVGNLPLCSACFRLRRKGNFCPLCQKCYEDNDFELKMMECGGCIRWVHARCEGLTDEQYNLLSVLPEHIEFICRKCSKSHENEAKAWRDAVAAEFKTGLLNIVKLLSKSRQANAFLKLSPRKISNAICVCRPLESNRRIRFNEDSADDSQSAVVPSSTVLDCHCQRADKTLVLLSDKTTTHLNLIDVKQKIHNDEYYSLQSFNYDMMTVIEPIMMVGGGSVSSTTASEDLMITYKEILSETFPWFQNETKACTDILVEAMNDACLYNNDDQMCGGIMVISGDQDESQQQQEHEQPQQQRRQTNDEYDQTVPAALSLPDDVEQFFYTNPKEADKRMCMFCKGVGETNANQEERLLYCGQNIWVHTNCALWSAEVFEEIDGSLQNVHSALSRGRLIKCSHCANKGATVGCNVRSCGEHFHYPCARQSVCSFLSDKTVYCPLHVSEGARKNLKSESNFRVNRPIYVEYDRKKKKYVEPREVQFLIGSLYVENIGRIIPLVSDEAVDCLIPCDYKCQRLYWSSKEPWRIVEYSIRTYIENTSTMGVDLGRNFTIDHTLNTQLVQLGLAQISRWHNNLSDGGEEEGPLQMTMTHSSLQTLQPGQYSSYQQRSGGEKLNRARLDHNPYSGMGMSNLIDENNEEEPQANNDLLPPEIKDAIFEDLPHDILDGISMLDIFPKLMTYEDLLMDTKHENPFSLAVSGAGENSSRSDLKMENSNSSSLGGDSGDNGDMNFSFFSGSSFRSELKRSNSDAVSGTSKQTAQQRNKFDVVAKKRKIGQSEMQFFGSTAKNKAETNDVFEKLKISQLDGAEDLIEGPVLCDRCHCTYRTKDSFIRHLDNCDLFSTSESESENIRSPTNSNTTSPPRIMIQQQQQQQHQPQQPQVSTLYFDNANNLIGNFENIDMNAMVSSSQQSFQILNATPINTSVPSLQYTQQSIHPGGGMTISSPKSGTSSTTTTTTKVLNLQNFSNQMLANQRKPHPGQPKQYGNDTNQLTLTNGINFANNITQQVNQQIPQLISVTLASPQHQQSYHATTSTATMVRNQPILSNQAKKQILPRLAQAPMQQPTHGLHSHKTPKMQKALKKGPEMITGSLQPQQHHIEYSTQTLQPQQATTTTIRNLNQLPSNIIYQQPTQQPILVQQMGQPNIMSYITTSGDQQNSTLQYVTIPTGNEMKTANGQSFLTTTQNPMLQGTLQSLTGDPNVGANSILVSTPNGLQVIPNTMQIAHMGQPQVIGTLIQPQGATIQCVNGMMSTEQMMLGAQPQLEMITDPTSGCMYLTQAQPVYYGLETIVQNTVMSSQQFVSTAMQGVLSQNSSFSATTTQVFQSSKIEPIMEVPAGYVVLNNMTGDNNMNMLATTTTTTQQQQQQAPQSQQSMMSQLQATPYDGTYTIGKPQAQQATIGSPQIIQSYAPSPQQQQQQQQIQQLQQQQQQIQQQINETSAQLMSSPPFILTSTGTGQTGGAGKVQTQLVNKVQPQTLTTVPNAPSVVNQIQITPTQPSDQQPTSQPPVLQLQNVIDQMNKQPQSILPKNVTIISNQTVNEASYRLGNATPKMTNIIRPIKNEKLVNAVAVKPKVVTKMNKMAMKVNQAPVMQQQQIQLLQTSTTAQAPPQTIVEPIVIKPQQQQQHQQQHQQQKMGANGVAVQGMTIAAKVQMNPRIQSNQPHLMQPQQHQQPQLPNMPPLGKIMETNPRKSQITVTGPIKTTNTITNSHVANPKMDNYGSIKPKEVPNTYLRQTAGQQAKQIINFNVEKSKPAMTYSNKMKINYDNMPPLTPTMTPRRREDFLKNKPDGVHPISTLTSAGQVPQKMGDPQYLPEQPQIGQQVNLHSVVPPPTSNVIQLPSAPYVPSSTGIPTNIVNPMQQPTNTQTSCSAVTNTTNVRPTNRVLPMQTINKQQKRQNQPPQVLQQHQPPHNQQPSMSHQPIPQYPPDVTITAINNISEGGGNKTATPIDLDKTFDSLFECSKISANLDDELKLTNALGNDITIIKTNLLLDAAATPPPSHDEKLITRDDDISTFDLGDGSELGKVSSNEDENTTSAGSNQATDNDVNSLFEDKISFGLEQSSSLSSDLRDEINKTPDIKEKISEILSNLDADDTSSATTATNVTPNVSMTSSASTQQMQQQFRQMDARRQHLQTQDSTIDISLLRGSTSTSNFSLFGSQKSATSTTSAASMIVEDSSNSSSGQSLVNSQLKYQALTKSEVSNDSRQFMLSTPEPSTSTASTATTSQQQKPAVPLIAKASGPRLLYEIQSEDGFTYKSTSISEVWEKVFETVQLARKAHGLMPLPDGPLEEMKGHQMLGLKTNALRYLLEQLPGVEKCSKYKPKYNQLTAKDGGSMAYATSTASSTQSCPSSTSGILSAGSSLCFSDDDLKENPYGAARCEPYSSRSEYDMFSWLASRHRKQPVPVVIHSNVDDILIPRRGSGSNLPMAMRYRTLKETSKDYVGVYRSHIHGRGLFCTRDIEAGEMVIEYAGELIRSTLTDKREKYYNSRGIGCYMFKIDENFVVDATMRGNAARFINHACEPNCYSKVVDILGHKHIIIFALRRLSQGEELTYDYKFPFEDEKIPCSCGSKKCRKYLN